MSCFLEGGVEAQILLPPTVPLFEEEKCRGILEGSTGVDAEDAT